MSGKDNGGDDGSGSDSSPPPSEPDEDQDHGLLVGASESSKLQRDAFLRKARDRPRILTEKVDQSESHPFARAAQKLLEEYDNTVYRICPAEPSEATSLLCESDKEELACELGNERREYLRDHMAFSASLSKTSRARVCERLKCVLPRGHNAAFQTHAFSESRICSLRDFEVWYVWALSRRNVDAVDVGGRAQKRQRVEGHKRKQECHPSASKKPRLARKAAPRFANVALDDNRLGVPPKPGQCKEPGLVMKHSEQGANAGNGLFTVKGLDAGVVVAIYTGQLIRSSESIPRGHEEYAFHSTWPNCQFLTVATPVSAPPTNDDDFAGLVNEPTAGESNIWSTHIEVIVDGVEVQLIVYYTARRIVAGEELTVVYGVGGPREAGAERGKQPNHSSCLSDADVYSALEDFCGRMNLSVEGVACTYGAVDGAGEGGSQSDDRIMNAILERNRRARR